MWLNSCFLWFTFQKCFTYPAKNVSGLAQFEWLAWRRTNPNFSSLWKCSTWDTDPHNRSWLVKRSTDRRRAWFSLFSFCVDDVRSLSNAGLAPDVFTAFITLDNVISPICHHSLVVQGRKIYLFCTRKRPRVVETRRLFLQTRTLWLFPTALINGFYSSPSSCKFTVNYKILLL
jgi:hypothetical protein